MLSGLLKLELATVEANRLAERSRDEAETDAMTDLHNRRGWQRVLEAEEARCLRYGGGASIVVIDLDGLKKINDFKGHHEGDEVIRRAARIIRTTTRASDEVARLGGDEFGVLTVECARCEAEELVHRIRRQFASEGIEASVGIATRIPAEGLNYAWQQADEAMYAEKEARRGAQLHTGADLLQLGMALTPVTEQAPLCAECQ